MTGLDFALITAKNITLAVIAWLIVSIVTGPADLGIALALAGWITAWDIHKETRP